MKRLLSTLLFFLCSLSFIKAEEVNIDGFRCRVYSARDTIQILKYTGDDPDIFVPNTLKYNEVDYKATCIHTLISARDASKPAIKSIYISENVREYKEYQTSGTNCPPIIVLENGNFSISGNTNGVLLNIQNASTSSFNCLITLTACKKTVNSISSNPSYLYKPGEIKVVLKNNETITVQMYLQGSDEKNRLTFDQTRLDYLISALTRQKTTLENIKSIDLSGMSINGKQIIFSISNTYGISLETIKDKADYTAPTTNYTGTIAYHRENTQYWNSVCLPFAITQSDFPEGTTIYQATRTTAEKVYLSKLENGQMLETGTPCYIYCENNTPWNLLLNNRTIAANQGAIEVVLGNWKLVGSFIKQTLGEGKYKLNSAGTEFVMTTSTSTVTPFRCYLTPTSTSSGAPSRLEVGIDDEAEITLVPDDRAPQQVKLYDLMGRPRRNNASGIYLRGK